MSLRDNARCVSSHAEDLANGRTVAPGQFFHLSADALGEPHNERLIENGKVILTSQEPELTGKALDKRAQELGIEGRSDMSADQLREAVAEAEANQGKGDGS